MCLLNRKLHVCFVIVIFISFVIGCDPAVIPGNNLTGKFISADISGKNNAKNDRNLSILSAQPASDSQQNERADNDRRQIIREIEEADIVKRIDNKIYLLNNARGLRIIDVSDWANPKLMGNFKFIGDPLEMYVNNGVACVIVRNYSRCRLDEQAKPIKVAESVILVIDISDSNNPELIDSFDIDGYVSETRRVGDVVYLAGYKSDFVFPYLLKNAETERQNQPDGFVMSVYIAEPDNVHLVDEKEISGRGEYIHATQNAIFVGGYDYDSGYSIIQYVDISDWQGQIMLKDKIEVPGRILNRFCIDAYDNQLRVITQSELRWVTEGAGIGREIAISSDSSASSVGKEQESELTGVNLFVYDISNPDEIAAISSLHIIDDEDLKAVRFDGDKGYVITFFQVDPLWVIDISNPSKPVISGHLEVPGYSTYLRPDGDRLIAVGIDNTSGWRASVMLYDVSNLSAPTELDRVVLGNEYSRSEANYDEKAMKVIPEAKLIFVPFDTYRLFAGRNLLAMIDYSQDKLTQLATISHRGTAIRCGVDLDDNILWILSQQAFQTLNISDKHSPSRLAIVGLAEDVFAWRILGEYGLRLVALNDLRFVSSDGDQSKLKVQLQVVSSNSPETQEILSSVDIACGYDAKLIVANPKLALIVTSLAVGKTRIYSIDLSELPKVSLAGYKDFNFILSDNLPVLPVVYEGYNDDRLYADMAVPMSMSFAPIIPRWNLSQENPILLSNNVLALIARKPFGSTGEINNVELKLIPLDNPSDLTISASVDLYSDEYNQIVNVSSWQNKIFCTLGQPIEENILSAIMGLNTDKPLASYYIRIIDCSDPSQPEVGLPINIPGLAVCLKDKLVLTVDPNWDNDKLVWNFCSVEIDEENADASLLNKIILGDNPPSDIKISGNLAIMAISQSNWFRWDLKEQDEADKCHLGSFKLLAVDFTNPNNLKINMDAKYPGRCELKAIISNTLVGQITSTRQAILWDISDENKLELKSIKDLPGYMNDVTGDDNTIEAACGKAGIIKLR